MKRNFLNFSLFLICLILFSGLQQGNSSFQFSFYEIQPTSQENYSFQHLGFISTEEETNDFTDFIVLFESEKIQFKSYFSFIFLNSYNSIPISLFLNLNSSRAPPIV